MHGKLGAYMILKNRLLLNFQCLKLLNLKLKHHNKRILYDKVIWGRVDGEMYFTSLFGDQRVKSLLHSWAHLSISSLAMLVNLMFLSRKAEITILTHNIFKILSFRYLKIHINIARFLIKISMIVSNIRMENLWKSQNYR
jgi:hypothetical protein